MARRDRTCLPAESGRLRGKTRHSQQVQQSISRGSETWTIRCKPDEISLWNCRRRTCPEPWLPKAIDAYFVGKPHAAKANSTAAAASSHAKDIWPHFISCVLVVTEKLIRERPDVVRDLVRGIAESGEWAEGHRLEAAKVVAPYFRQDEKVIRYVLTQPPNRVSYRMLTPTDEDLQQINDMAVKAGILERPIAMKDLIDRQFIPLDIKPANIDTGQ